MKEIEGNKNTTDTKIMHKYWRVKMKIITKIGALAVLFLLAVGVLWAGEITGGVGKVFTSLKTYVDGEYATAYDVNQNFAVVREEVNNNHDRISTLESTAAIRNGSLQTDLNADMLDGLHSSSFASSSHWHYYLHASDGSPTYAVYANPSGNVGIGTTGPAEKLHVNGNLRTTSVKYNSPRTHYYTISAEGFNPASDVAFGNSWGMGGAYITSGTGALVAPVQLPHGAVVTSFKVFFNTNAALTASLQYHPMASGAFWTMGSVTSGTGYNNRTDTSINYATIDNTSNCYFIRAYSSSWSSSLNIMGAVITYTISEAP